MEERFVLNDSKRNALPLLFTIYAVRLNSFSFWLRVHEIPTRKKILRSQFRAYGIRSSLVLRIEEEDLAQLVV